MGLFFARFNGPGPAVEQRSSGGFELLELGFVPISIPTWTEFGQWAQVRVLENGGVEFDFPSHVRNWEGFKDSLIANQRSQEVMAATLSHPALGTALTLFLSAIDSLVQRATPQRLATFHGTWLAFRGVIESLTASQDLGSGIIEEMEAIALTFDIELPAPAEETPTP